MKAQFSVSVDLDAIHHYYRIHALGPAPAKYRHLILERSLPRFAELFEELGIGGTFFVVAEDVDPERFGDEVSSTRALLADLAARGHEIASHSYSHPYELARLTQPEIADEIARSHELLSELAGRNVVGFRSPGYDLSPAVLSELLAHGYHYDSSVFPAPAYYAAKAAVMAAMRLVGRPTGAVLTNPRALMAPADPYRPAAAAPWRRGSSPLVELPIAVTPGLRVPVIGTSIAMAPDFLRRRWGRVLGKRTHINFELHGIDLVDADTDGLPAELAARQPDLRRPWTEKRDKIAAFIRQLAESHESGTLAEVAAAWAERL